MRLRIKHVTKDFWSDPFKYASVPMFTRRHPTPVFAYYDGQVHSVDQDKVYAEFFELGVHVPQCTEIDDLEGHYLKSSAKLEKVSQDHINMMAHHADRHSTKADEILVVEFQRNLFSIQTCEGGWWLSKKSAWVAQVIS